MDKALHELCNQFRATIYTKFSYKKREYFLILGGDGKIKPNLLSGKREKNMNYLKLIPLLKKLNKLNRNYKILRIFKLGVAAAIDGLA